MSDSAREVNEPADTPAVNSSSEGVRSTVGRAAVVLVAATVVSGVLGLLREAVMSTMFGQNGVTDAFNMAYRIPYALSVIAAAALTAAFVPLFSYRLAKGKKEEAWRLSINIGNITLIVLVVLCAIMMIFGHQVIRIAAPGFKGETLTRSVFLFRIVVGCLLFSGISGLLIGILNSLRRFALAAFSPVLGTAVTLILTLILARSLGITSLAIGTVTGAFVAMAVLLIGLRGSPVPYRPRIEWRDPAVRETAYMIWPILIGSAVGTVNTLSDQFLGSLLAAGSISALGYATKLFQFPLGIFAQGITVPIFPLLSQQVAEERPDRVKATISYALRLMGFLLIPTTVAIGILRKPLVGVILQHGKYTVADTGVAATVLLALIISLYFYAGAGMVTRVFYAYHDTRSPVAISIASMILNVAFSFGLMQVLGVTGLALGTTLSTVLNFVVLIYILRRKIGQIGFRDISRALLRVLGMSIVMGVVVWAADFWLAHNLAQTFSGYAVRVVVGLVLSAVLYLGIAKLIKVPEAADAMVTLRGAFRWRQRG